MPNDYFIFDDKNLSSIGVFDIKQQKFERLQNVTPQLLDRIIQVPFDFYYHGEIMIIPQQITNTETLINVSLNDQQLQTSGNIYFFHYRTDKQFKILSSLLLPEEIYIQNYLLIQ